MKKILVSLILASLSLIPLPGLAIPSAINYQGRLTDASGDPYNGQAKFIIRLYDNETGGSPLYEESMGKVNVINGIYSFRFGSGGSGSSLGMDIFQTLSDAENWLALEVNGTELSPRIRLLAVPFAMKARESADAQALAAELAAISLEREFSLIPAGSFSMGDAFSEGRANELPQHEVSVAAFYMGRTEVTKAHWDRVRAWALNHGYTSLTVGLGKSPCRPVGGISWCDAVKWLNALSEMHGLTPVYTVGGIVMRTGTDTPDINYAADGYRLPTEAEWEKAARGGLVTRRFPWGNEINHHLANYQALPASYPYDTNPATGYNPAYDDGREPLAPAASFTGNGYGLHNMAGNVWEYCNDWLSDSYYATSPSNNPTGPNTGVFRVIRGGSDYAHAYECRVSYRGGSGPNDWASNIGFRVTRNSVP